MWSLEMTSQALVCAWMGQLLKHVEDKLGGKSSHRFKGHGEPADLPSVHSHRSMGELAGEQVGFRQRVALGMKQRQN